jgi:hypothetical protein
MPATKNLVKDAHWKDRYYVLAYELARDGCPKKDIPAALGVPETLWAKWVRKDKTLSTAIERGAKKKTNTGPKTADPVFRYVYRHLPPDLRRVWNRIEKAFGDAAESGEPFDHEAFLEGVMIGKGLRCRQHLYVHALVANNFDGNKACYMTGVSHAEVAAWAERDEGFRELCAAIKTIKADFVEGAAFKLISRGDPTTTVFAAKCLLADRGWKPPPKEVKNEHSGSTAHLHAVVEISEEELESMTPDEIETVLNARKVLRAAKERKRLPPKVVTDAD